MDSLLASYASSDEEDEPQKPQPAATLSSSSSRVSSRFSSLPQPKSSSSAKGEEPDKLVKSSSLFSSIPHPKSSSLFSSLPQPKQSGNDGDEVAKSSNPNSLFSSLPPPNSNLSSSLPKPRKVVQFKPPPINPIPNNLEDEDDDDDDDDEEKERRKRRESESLGTSFTSFLSKIPAPRNSATLGAGTSLGSGRRSVIDTQVSGTSSSSAINESEVNYASINQTPENSYGNYESSIDQNTPNSADNASYGDHEVGAYQNAGMYGDQASYGSYQSSTDPNVGSNDASYYGGYESHGSYYGQHENSWVGASATMVPESTGLIDAVFHIPKKRGRKDVPTEIVEVKQDELMKNRPREDQAKLTGIAFGPSYQPVSTSKGKPSKLHKRKHQIGTLYFDMRQKESELAERRARGQLTKAETHAKYGW